MPGVPRAASVWRSEVANSESARPACRLAVQRLKTRSQFQAVLAGDKLISTEHFALHCCGLNGRATSAGLTTTKTVGPLFDQKDVWLGAVVPKRLAKHAVTRNAIKRQIYNVSSRISAPLPVSAYVVRLRAGFDRGSFPSASSMALKLAVRKELEKLFSDAIRLRTAVQPLKGSAC